MGYYSRARNLRRAAMEVVRRGKFPQSAKELQKLPGVGAYTAAAVASIAFGEAEPALDGNQARVLSRLLAFDETVDTPQRLRKPAEALIDRERPGDYNQALMDLGSGICTPRAPKCEKCPVIAFCAARAEGDAEGYPRLPPPIVKREVDVTVALAYLHGRVLVRRRPSKGLLAGLWNSPILPRERWRTRCPGRELRERCHARGTYSRTLSGTCAACAPRWTRCRRACAPWMRKSSKLSPSPPRCGFTGRSRNGNCARACEKAHKKTTDAREYAHIRRFAL